METKDPRSWIPQVEALLQNPGFSTYLERLSRPLASRVISQTLEDFRNGLVAESPHILLDESIVRSRAIEACSLALEKKSRQSLRKVLNGTGVVLHTNLGRSPLPKAIWDAAGEINTGYSNLEFALDSGERGPRGGLAFEYLCAITGAPAALAVNNNAAAILLALGALAKGKEVLVSRGEAVQIGGGFRIPDILALSGAILKEVGTTNITTVQDYTDALGQDTAAVLLVHSSNFALRGFVEKPSLSTLNKALPKGILRIVDQGSGTLTENLGSEPSASSLLRAGADLVCFSGDKILGGPQAGLVVGRADLISLLARHPLMRAFRPGKTVLSLLEASLMAKLKAESGYKPKEAATYDSRANAHDGDAFSYDSAARIALRLSAESGLATLRAFGRSVLRRLPQGIKARIRLTPSRATLGGGSTPDETISSLALRISPIRSAAALAENLRRAPLPLVARIEDQAVVVDLMALAGEASRDIAETLAFAMAKEQA